VVENTRALQALRSDTPQVAQSSPSADLTLGAVIPASNPALVEWQQHQS
jgi:hypothetical protein